MPIRTITVDGKTWRVFPSGWTTIYNLDEFGLIFVAGEGNAREVRTTRYSPQGTRSREQSLYEMSDARLVELLRYSQPSATSPEAGYRDAALPGTPEGRTP
jgi:hypothetical protein